MAFISWLRFVVVSSFLLSNYVSQKIPTSTANLIPIIAHVYFSIIKVFFPLLCLVVVLDDGNDAVKGGFGGFVEWDF